MNAPMTSCVAEFCVINGPHNQSAGSSAHKQGCHRILAVHSCRLGRGHEEDQDNLSLRPLAVHDVHGHNILTEEHGALTLKAKDDRRTDGLGFPDAAHLAPGRSAASPINPSRTCRTCPMDGRRPTHGVGRDFSPSKSSNISGQAVNSDRSSVDASLYDDCVVSALGD